MYKENIWQWKENLNKNYIYLCNLKKDNLVGIGCSEWMDQNTTFSMEMILAVVSGVSKRCIFSSLRIVLNCLCTLCYLFDVAVFKSVEGISRYTFRCIHVRGQQGQHISDCNCNFRIVTKIEINQCYGNHHKYEQHNPRSILLPQNVNLFLYKKWSPCSSLLTPAWGVLGLWVLLAWLPDCGVIELGVSLILSVPVKWLTTAENTSETPTSPLSTSIFKKR